MPIASAIELRPTQSQDIRRILWDLRESDWREVAASSRLPVGHAIAMSAARGETHTAWCSGEPIALFGVVSSGGIGRSGCTWLVGTNAIGASGLRALRISRSVVDRWQADFDCLTNFVDARNTISQRWLKWLGFRLYPAAPYGPQDRLFHKFEWRR